MKYSRTHLANINHKWHYQYAGSQMHLGKSGPDVSSESTVVSHGQTGLILTYQALKLSLWILSTRV